jgi:glyoxylase-like metal-dependent hydrolase (beta-lactamase superfamily II)
MSNANELELALHYPLGDQLPPRGGTIEIAPGLKWARMTLPFALNHINVWLLRDRLDGREGWTVVDTCIDRQQSREDWQKIFDAELDGLPVLRVLVTHMHPDHVGLAHWLCERWSTPGRDCRLWMSASDFTQARQAVDSDGSRKGGKMSGYFASHGLVDPAVLGRLGQGQSSFRNMVPALPSSYARLLDGASVTIGDHTWRCIVGYGHALEHIALYCAQTNTLISGDMVLPRISTNVSVYEMEPEGDPLALFLTSLERYRALPADTLVLPAHGRPFTGLHTRLDQLREHHQERLADLLTAARAQPVSAHDILPLLFHRKLDLHQTTFAMGEAVAHLNYLWHADKLTRARDGAGVWRYAAA